jgi:hypothetical protein
VFNSWPRERNPPTTPRAASYSSPERVPPLGAHCLNRKSLELSACASDFATLRLMYSEKLIGIAILGLVAALTIFSVYESVMFW